MPHDFGNHMSRLIHNVFLTDVPDWDMSLFDTIEDYDPRPELTLKPVAMFRCPFRKGKHKIVLCQPMDKERVPCE